MKEILAQANDFVTKKELDYSKMLFEDLAESKKHAQGCNCPSCWKVVEGIRDEITREAWRIFDPDPVDHEELWIERNK